MSANSSLKGPNGKSDLTSGILRRMRQVVGTVLLVMAILFISAGRLDWAWVWVYFGMYVGGLTINLLVVVPRNPEMVVERGQIKEGVKGWDKVLGAFIGIPTLGMLILAGLDARWGWSPQLALAIHLVALVFAALGNGLFSWAMASNKFFSRYVRIQIERDHTVATGGPYRYVRHPGYAGMIISLLTTPLLLGSLWALVPAGLAACLYVVRTALEDRTLQEELEGYKEYTQRVRYRLLPGVW
jgi:protein-S-isoprenylcysteine O-methyltransferase Ste14